MKVEMHIERTIWQVECLPLNILFSVKHFELFFNSRFSTEFVNKEAAEEFKLAMWRNFTKWLGIPRITDFLFAAAVLLLGHNLQNLEADKSKRKHQLSLIDSSVTKKAIAYYKIKSDFANIKVSPYVLLTVAAGVPTPRNQVVPGTSETFSDFEIQGYLFPANDYALGIIWASNLLYFDIEEWPKVYPSLFPLITTQASLELNNIAHPLEEEFKNPASFLKLLLLDCYLTREQVWKSPEVKGVLEYVVATTIWLRYILQRMNKVTQTSILLKDLIYSLPESLKSGISICKIFFLTQLYSSCNF